MREFDPTIEQVTKEIAEILAKAYLRVLAKRREAPAAAGAPSGTTAVEEEHSSSARQKTGLTPKAVSTRLTDPLPTPPKVPTSSRTDIPESLCAEIAARLQKLAGMNSTALRAEYQRLFSAKPTSSNRQHLLRHIAWEIQAQTGGRLPEEVRQYACRIAEQTDLFQNVKERLQKQRAPASPVGSSDEPKRRRGPHPKANGRDPRIPAPGSLLIVRQGRQTVRVTVLQTGFEYEGKPYRSLTAVAKQITGRSVNAYEFFGLGAPGQSGKS